MIDRETLLIPNSFIVELLINIRYLPPPATTKCDITKLRNPKRFDFGGQQEQGLFV